MAGDRNELEKWATDVIFGRARGFWPAVMRIVLRGFSWLYRFGVRLRLRLYRKGWLEQSSLGTMVVSIGNITVGGTGKTPVVERIARELAGRGRKVAILSRGYKSSDLKEPQVWVNPETGFEVTNFPKIVSDGREVLLPAKYAGDEPYMLAMNLPGVAVVVDRDRVRGGRFAVKELGVEPCYLMMGCNTFIWITPLMWCWWIKMPFGNATFFLGNLAEPPPNLVNIHFSDQV